MDAWLHRLRPPDVPEQPQEAQFTVFQGLMKYRKVCMGCTKRSRKGDALCSLSNISCTATGRLSVSAFHENRHRSEDAISAISEQFRGLTMYDVSCRGSRATEKVRRPSRGGRTFAERSFAGVLTASGNHSRFDVSHRSSPCPAPQNSFMKRRGPSRGSQDRRTKMRVQAAARLPRA